MKLQNLKYACRGTFRFLGNSDFSTCYIQQKLVTAFWTQTKTKSKTATYTFLSNANDVWFYSLITIMFYKKQGENLERNWSSIHSCWFKPSTVITQASYLNFLPLQLWHCWLLTKIFMLKLISFWKRNRCICISLYNLLTEVKNKCENWKKRLKGL